MTTDDTAMVTTGEYFGGCPKCGKTDGYVNIGSNHWFTCKEHLAAWCAGSNLFSDWRHEHQAQWDATAERLEREGYEVVEPIYPPPDADEDSEEQEQFPVVYATKLPEPAH